MVQASRRAAPLCTFYNPQLLLLVLNPPNQFFYKTNYNLKSLKPEATISSPAHTAPTKALPPDAKAAEESGMLPHMRKDDAGLGRAEEDGAEARTTAAAPVAPNDEGHEQSEKY